MKIINIKMVLIQMKRGFPILFILVLTLKGSIDAELTRLVKAPPLIPGKKVLVNILKTMGIAAADLPEPPKLLTSDEKSFMFTAVVGHSPSVFEVLLFNKGNAYDLKLHMEMVQNKEKWGEIRMFSENSKTGVISIDYQEYFLVINQYPSFKLLNAPLEVSDGSRPEEIRSKIYFVVREMFRLLAQINLRDKLIIGDVKPEKIALMNVYTKDVEGKVAPRFIGIPYFITKKNTRLCAENFSPNELRYFEDLVAKQGDVQKAVTQWKSLRDEYFQDYKMMMWNVAKTLLAFIDANLGGLEHESFVRSLHQILLPLLEFSDNEFSDIFDNLIGLENTPGNEYLKGDADDLNVMTYHTLSRQDTLGSSNSSVNNSLNYGMAQDTSTDSMKKGVKNKWHII